MRIIEQFIKGKDDNPELCEDGIVVTEDFIAIVDGVSSRNNFRYNGKKLGKIICDILMEAIPHLEKTASCEAAMDFLNSYIRNRYKEYGILDWVSSDAANQPAASVGIYSDARREIWMVGDCLALVGDEAVSGGLAVDDLYARIRAMVLEYLLATEYTEDQLLEHDISRDVTNVLTKLQPYTRNKNYNNRYDHAVIDGLHRPRLDLIKVIKIPENIHQLVLATDGYRRPCPTLQESEDFNRHVRELDPLCYKEYLYEKGFDKKHENYDDRAYVRFEI